MATGRRQSMLGGAQSRKVARRTLPRAPLSPVGPESIRRRRPEPTHEEIAKRAYEIWLSGSREPGHDQEHWLQAERELKRN